MNIVQICQIKFPDAIRDSKITFRTDDNINLELATWDIDEVARPTEEQILAWENDQDFIDLVTAKNKAEHNAPILEELDKLDLKSIRAIRAGDPQYIEIYEQQAAALRAQLL